MLLKQFKAKNYGKFEYFRFETLFQDFLAHDFLQEHILQPGINEFESSINNSSFLILKLIPNFQKKFKIEVPECTVEGQTERRETGNMGEYRQLSLASFAGKGVEGNSSGGYFQLVRGAVTPPPPPTRWPKNIERTQERGHRQSTYSLVCGVRDRVFVQALRLTINSQTLIGQQSGIQEIYRVMRSQR